MLSENNQIIFDEKSIDDSMIKYFVNTPNKLKLQSIHTETKSLFISKVLGRYKYRQRFVKTLCRMKDEVNIYLLNLSYLKKYLKILIPKKMKRRLSYPI